MEAYLAFVWASILVFGIAMYVVLDGFDLGIGILFPTTGIEGERDQMMNTVAPFWDGNETWLVLGGGGLFVAFPYAYSIIMPAMHIPILVMLLALVLRGVAFEFRWVAKPHHHWWDRAFFFGSAIAAFAQGCVLGGMLQGVTVVDGQFAGSSFDWLTPFSLFCGLGVTVGYALLGACWINYKTVGMLQEKARRQAKGLLILLLVFIVAVSLWTPLRYPWIAERWFNWNHLLFLWPVPLATVVAGWIGYESLRRGGELVPFGAVVALFLMSGIGLGISTYPFLVPPSVTLFDAAGAPESLIFALMGVLFVLPLVLLYTAANYWTFRGKVLPDDGYH